MTEKGNMSNAQQEQAQLLEEAMKRPGVASAVEAYSRVQAYASTTTGVTTVKTGYATGGNTA